MESPHNTWKRVCMCVCACISPWVCVSLGGRWKWCLALKQDSCANRQPWCQDCRGFWVGRGQTHFDARFYSSPQSRCGTGDLERGYEELYTVFYMNADIIWVYKWKQIIDMNVQKKHPSWCPWHILNNIPKHQQFFLCVRILSWCVSWMVLKAIKSDWTLAIFSELCFVMVAWACCLKHWRMWLMVRSYAYLWYVHRLTFSPLM